MRTCLPVTALVFLTAQLVAANAGGGRSGIADSGKADAERVFARQAGTVPGPQADQPAAIGSYVWGGRADENYKPFFQWELRMKSGSAALSGFRLRVITLGPLQEVGSEGPWRELGTLAANAAQDVSYRINGPAFSAWKLELQWKAGKQTAIASDKFSVPIPTSDLANTPALVTTNVNFDYDDKKKAAAVAWSLWNLGGQPAKDVVLTIRFLDESGKEVKTAEWKPDQGVVVPAYCKEHHLVVAAVPRFASVSISNRQGGGDAPVDGGFTGAKDVEVTRLRGEGKQLKARVRNGTDTDLESLVLTIRLLNKDGKESRKVAFPLARLGRNDEQDIAADIPAGVTWATYEISWAAGKVATATPPAAVPKSPMPAAGAAAPTDLSRITSDGLVFTQVQTTSKDGTLFIKGRLANQRSQALGNLLVTFKVSHQDKSVTSEVRQERLEKDQTAVVILEIPGFSAIDGLSMQWKAGVALK